MKYFPQMGMWQRIVLALLTCHFGTANLVIHVEKPFMNCLQELRKQPHSEVTIKKITFVSTIKQCSNRHRQLEKLINHEKNDEIQIVFGVTRVILKINDKIVELVQNNAKKTRAVGHRGQRFLGLPSISSVVGNVKSWFQGPGEEPSSQVPDQSVYLPQQYYPPPSPQFQIPESAQFTGLMIDDFYRAINFMLTTSTEGFKRFILKWISDPQGCVNMPPISLDIPTFRFLFHDFRVCGLADVFLRPITKTLGPGYWNVAYFIEFPETYMSFGSFNLRTSMLPWPLSNIKLDSVQFQCDRTVIRMSMNIPYDFPSIPSNLNIAIERMDNFRVSFLTPYPSIKQRLLGKALEKSIQFTLNVFLKLLSSIL